MDELPYEVKKKIIKSGNVIELFEYEKGYWVGWPQIKRFKNKFEKERDRQRKELMQTKIREDNVRRARQKIMRIMYSNPQLQTFLTLTFGSEVLDLKTSNQFFDRFVKRMSYAQPDFQYMAVPEFQNKSKRVHYHLVTNYPIPVFKNDDERMAYERWFEKEHWKNGFVCFKQIDNSKNLGYYISKYLSKEMFDERYFRKRKFFYSKDLNLPEVIDHAEEVEDFLSFFEPEALELVRENEFYSHHCGQTKHNTYKIAQMQNHDELEKYLLDLAKYNEEVKAEKKIKKPDINEITF